MADGRPLWPISHRESESSARTYGPAAGPKTSPYLEAQLDEALEMTFPASDPVAIGTPGRGDEQ